MSAYDLKSYALAVRLRTRKTILLEGSTDKLVIGRLLTEHESTSGLRRQCVVDDVSILVRESTFTGLGNRDRVMGVANSICAQEPKLKCLIDREWDGIDLRNLSDPLPQMAPPAWGHITMGHSIENYWFSISAATSYLKMHFGADLTGDYFDELAKRFESMLRLAAGFSLAAQRLQVIRASNHLINRALITWSEGRYSTLPALAAVAGARGITSDLHSETCAELSRDDMAALSLESIQWLCHGHLGDQVLRACAANLAVEIGIPEVAEGIERGFVSSKLSHDADFLARSFPASVNPIDDLIFWAT